MIFKRITLLLVCALITVVTFGQTELAIIDDPDGYVNVRSEKNSGSDIVTTIPEGKFFLCEPASDNWWKVSTFYSRTGFVHKSRIVLVKNLNDELKREMIVKSFDGLKSRRQKSDSLRLVVPDGKRMELLRELEDFEETVYSPLLTYLSEIFCKNKDKALLNSFLYVMITNQMSANETPSWTLGYCYLCHPDLVLQQINNHEETDKKHLKSMLTFGFENVTWQKENEIENYQILKEKIE